MNRPPDEVRDTINKLLSHAASSFPGAAKNDMVTAAAMLVEYEALLRAKAGNGRGPAHPTVTATIVG